MSAPDKCPSCGEGKCRDTVGKREYLCGTWRFHHQDGVAESTTCLTNQLKMRDARIKELELKNELNATRELELGAALARVKELEAKLAEVTADRDSWAEQADQRATDAVEAMKRESEWKAYAWRLEDTGDLVASWAPEKSRRAWKQAKETKP